MDRRRMRNVFSNVSFFLLASDNTHQVQNQNQEVRVGPAAISITTETNATLAASAFAENAVNYSKETHPDTYCCRDFESIVRESESSPICTLVLTN